MKVFKFLIVLVVLAGLISGCANNNKQEPTPTVEPLPPAQQASNALTAYKSAITANNPNKNVLEKTIFVVHTDGKSIAFVYENGTLTEKGEQSEPPTDYELDNEYTAGLGEEISVYLPQAILQVQSVNAKVGEEFTFLISIENDALWDWATFEFIINYDPALIKVNEIVKTEYISDMIFQPNTEYTASSCKAVAITAEDLQDAKGDLVEVRCTALKAGEVEITLSEYIMYQVKNGANGEPLSVPIALGVRTGKITISE
ncbi:MAG: hypothetical protein GX802_00705 [Clostridiales bacterium]|nr:hypothetical protein [Clostridiales bacterium]